MTPRVKVFAAKADEFDPNLHVRRMSCSKLYSDLHTCTVAPTHACVCAHTQLINQLM